MLYLLLSYSIFILTLVFFSSIQTTKNEMSGKNRIVTVPLYSAIYQLFPLFAKIAL